MHLQFVVNKSIKEVYQCLSNMNSFVKVHPLITDMKPNQDGSYLVYEQLKLGIIRFRFTYPCNVKSNVEMNSITMNAVVKKVMHINLVFKLSQQNNQTIVDEYITFKSFLPLLFIMKSIFKKQHHILFRNIETMN